MNKVFWGIVAGLAIGVVGTAVVLKYLPSRSEEPELAQPRDESLVPQNADDQMVVKLAPDTRILMGLKVATLVSATLVPEVKGYGRVLDPTPLAALVAERASAQTALGAATREYERVKTLYSQGQATSARALETAEAAMNTDRVTLESTQLRLLTGWGNGIASRADLSPFVGSLAAQRAALIRVDLPLGEGLKARPSDGWIAPAGTPENRIPAQVVGLAPSVDPQTQGQGFLLLAKTDLTPGSQDSATERPPLPPGLAVIGWLTIPGAPLDGVKVPEAAILRHQGRAWVYLATDNTTFTRRAVTLSHPVEGGWLIVGQLRPEERIVVCGTQMLLSEELKSSISADD